MVYIGLIWHWILTIGLCGGYLSADTANSFLPALNGCLLRDEYFSTRSGKPAFADTVLKLSLSVFDH